MAFVSKRLKFWVFLLAIVIVQRILQFNDEISVPKALNSGVVAVTTTPSLTGCSYIG